jgi:hypothetical protein
MPIAGSFSLRHFNVGACRAFAAAHDYTPRGLGFDAQRRLASAAGI